MTDPNKPLNYTPPSLQPAADVLRDAAYQSRALREKVLASMNASSAYTSQQVVIPQQPLYGQPVQGMNPLYPQVQVQNQYQQLQPAQQQQLQAMQLLQQQQALQQQQLAAAQQDALYRQMLAQVQSPFGQSTAPAPTPMYIPTLSHAPLAVTPVVSYAQLKPVEVIVEKKIEKKVRSQSNASFHEFCIY